jgi:hypothetical protein
LAAKQTRRKYANIATPSHKLMWLKAFSARIFMCPSCFLTRVRVPGLPRSSYKTRAHEAWLEAAAARAVGRWANALGKAVVESKLEWMARNLTLHPMGRAGRGRPRRHFCRARVQGGARWCAPVR